MLHVVLYQPEIPPNTGNVIRLCSNCGARLSLIHPLGFELDDKRLRRAGLDYREWADVREYSAYEDFLASEQPNRVFAFSRFATRNYAEVRYQDGDALMFGPETRGLPKTLLGELPESQRVLIPMRAGNRSLNLSNAVAVGVYEAWRQLGFE